MIYAVYRCLYGEDYVQQSINSITDYVDKIFVFWDDRPWGDVTECLYKGNTVIFPRKFDNILDKIRELNNPKIELIYDHQYNNINQFTHFTNDIIIPNFGKPDILLMLEIDQVFRKDQLEKTFEEFQKKGYINASTKQIELWRYFNYRVPDRLRLCAVLWNLKNLDKMPPTERHANILGGGIRQLETYVHNFGFAVSEKTMFWKYMAALAFSQKIRDAIPNENWYEDKWLKWDYKTNNKDLEVSLGFEHDLPYAHRYDINELPEQMKELISTHVDYL